MYSFHEFDVADNPAVIFRGIVGSHAYGTANAALDWVVRRETMPPTAFAAVPEGSPLSADETADMEELLAMKARATHTESAAFHRGAF